MSIFALSQLIAAFSNIPVAVQVAIAVLTFILFVFVLVNKKACDNLIRMIAAIRGDHSPKH